MIAALSLANLLSIIWAAVFVMAVCAVSYWASRRSNIPAGLIDILTRSKAKPVAPSARDRA